MRACDSAMRSCRNVSERVRPPLYALPLNELASIVFEGIGAQALHDDTPDRSTLREPQSPLSISLGVN
jgi:hypothetical protein